ncbi:MAG: hypothetical protein Kow0069_17190 [Promethearchaeota archaeon]
MNQRDEDSGEKKVARDLVKLRHVETRKQEVAVAPELREQLELAEQKRRLESPLSNEEVVVLSALEQRRMFLSRVAIVVNQGRVPLGLPPLGREELEGTLSRLVERGLVERQLVRSEGQERWVYFLTEAGREQVV